MKSTIIFNSAEELAKFLAAFIPTCSAIFKVEVVAGDYILTFTGGF